MAEWATVFWVAFQSLLQPGLWGFEHEIAELIHTEAYTLAGYTSVVVDILFPLRGVYGQRVALVIAFVFARTLMSH